MAKSLDITFRGKDEGTIALMQAAQKEADGLRSKLEAVNKTKVKPQVEKGGFSDALHDLKSDFGKGSDVALLGKTLIGGGAIAGLSIIGNELDKITAKMVELRNQYKAGEVDAAAMVHGLAQSIPVLGQMVTFFDNIRELVTGEKAELDLINQENKLTESLISVKQAGIKSQLESEKQIVEELRKANNERKLAIAIAGGNVEEIRNVETGNKQDDLVTGQAAKQSQYITARKSQLEEEVKKQTAIWEIQKQQKLDENWNSVGELKDGESHDFKERREARAKIINSEYKHQEEEYRRQKLGDNTKNWETNDSGATSNDKNSQLYKDAQEHKKGLDAVAAAEAAKAAAVAARQLKADGEAQVAIITAYDVQIADGKAKALIDQKKAMGFALDAELLLIKKNASDKKAAIDKSAADQIAKAPNEQFKKDIGEKAEAAKSQVDNSAFLDTQLLKEKTLKDLQLSGMQAEAAAGNATAAIELARFQQQGQNQAIELQLSQLYAQQTTEAGRLNVQLQIDKFHRTQALSLQHQLNDAENGILAMQAGQGNELANIELKRREQKEKDIETEAKLLAILKQQNTEAGKKEAQGAIDTFHATQKMRAERDIYDQQQNYLQKQAEVGTGSEKMEAKKQLEKNRLIEEWKKAEAETQKVLNNENLSAEQKEAAKSRLKNMGDLLALQYDKDIGEKEPLKRTANLEEKGLLISGVAAATRSEPQDRIAENTAESKELQRKFNEAFDAFVKWTQEQKPQGINVQPGVLQ